MKVLVALATLTLAAALPVQEVSPGSAYYYRQDGRVTFEHPAVSYVKPVARDNDADLVKRAGAENDVDAKNTSNYWADPVKRAGDENDVDANDHTGDAYWDVDPPKLPGVISRAGDENDVDAKDHTGDAYWDIGEPPSGRSVGDENDVDADDHTGQAYWTDPKIARAGDENDVDADDHTGQAYWTDPKITK